MKTEKIISILILFFSIILTLVFFVLKDTLSGTVTLGLIGLFILNFISSAALFISAPSIFAVIAGGSMYPPLSVGLVSGFGSALGDIVGYAFGTSSRKLANHKLHNKTWYKVLSEYFHKYGGIILVIFAFIPNPLFDSIGIIAGIFNYPPWKFFILVLIGRFVRYYMLARFGAIF